MSNTEIKVDGEDVNRVIAAAIINSKIGQQVEAATNRVLVELSKSYQNPIDEVIKRHVAEIARGIVAKEYATQIGEKVRAFIARTITDEMIARAANAVVEQMTGRF